MYVYIRYSIPRLKLLLLLLLCCTRTKWASIKKILRITAIVCRSGRISRVIHLRNMFVFDADLIGLVFNFCQQPAEKSSRIHDKRTTCSSTKSIVKKKTVFALSVETTTTYTDPTLTLRELLRFENRIEIATVIHSGRRVVASEFK